MNKKKTRIQEIKEHIITSRTEYYGIFPEGCKLPVIGPYASIQELETELESFHEIEECTICTKVKKVKTI